MKPNASFTNTRWKMVKLAGLESFPKLQKDAFIQFDSASSRCRGNAGCNNFQGSYKIDGNKISLGAAAMTRMLCPGDGMKVEDMFSKAMHSVDSFLITGDHMLLKSGDKIVAEFEALYL
jgi:heat shock protein HslJ